MFFGDNIDDANALPWTREQAWSVLKQLSQRGEVPYYEVLLEFPFKGDEKALHSLENAEIITIGTSNGRPSSIRAGKPVLQWAFKELAKDPIFRATQDVSLNEKAILSNEKIIFACEEELKTLQGIASMERSWWHFGLGESNHKRARINYLSKRMLGAVRKIEILERQNFELRKILQRDG